MPSGVSSRPSRAEIFPHEILLKAKSKSSSETIFCLASSSRRVGSAHTTGLPAAAQIGTGGPPRVNTAPRPCPVVTKAPAGSPPAPALLPLLPTCSSERPSAGLWNLVPLQGKSNSSTCFNISIRRCTNWASHYLTAEGADRRHLRLDRRDLLLVTRYSYTCARYRNVTRVTRYVSLQGKGDPRGATHL